MGLPRMPLVANDVVAVEDGDPIDRIVLPASAGVSDRLSEE